MGCLSSGRISIGIPCISPGRSRHLQKKSNGRPSNVERGFVFYVSVLRWQVRAKERALREREAGLQAGEAAAAKYCAKDSALEQREAALAEREAAMARATAAAEYARSEAETLWRSHKVRLNV